MLDKIEKALEEVLNEATEKYSDDGEDALAYLAERSITPNENPEFIFSAFDPRYVSLRKRSGESHIADLVMWIDTTKLTRGKIAKIVSEIIGC